MTQRKAQPQPLSPELRESLPRVNLDALIGSVRYDVPEAFTRLCIKDPVVRQGCPAKPCLDFCPAGVYRLDRQGHVMDGYQACLECVSCRVGCPFQNIGWALPRGGYGVAYKLG